MGKFSTWSKEEDEAVLKLYDIYGPNFTEICRSLKTIYGIKKNRTTLISHWRVIDPKAN